VTLASTSIGKLPIAAQDAATTTPRPRNRTATAIADIVSDPEAR
jgi:hypothetical protein